MEFLVPSLLILLLAAFTVFFIVPRVSTQKIFIISIVLLTLAVYAHYMMFKQEYATSVWRDSIQTYAPTILIILVVIGVIVSFSNLFTNLNFRIGIPKLEFFKPRNIKQFSNVKGYSEIPLSRVRELERQI